MTKIRVLVADDSWTVREQVTRWLALEPDMEVVATAGDGSLVAEKVDTKRADVVLLDVDMPVVGGLDALRAVRARHPRIPVIIFSALTMRGGMVTLEALSLGASDYVLKPTSLAGVTPDDVRSQLVEKIRRLHERALAPVLIPAAPRGPSPTRSEGSGAHARHRPPRVDLVAIGSSTGGPTALERVFRALPGDLRVPVVVVQHMPPLFTKSLAERLSRVTPLRVQEATDGAPISGGGAWIAPGGHHMTVERDGARLVVRTNDDPPENSCRPSVDVLFRSVARAVGHGGLGIVLTGMGYDGLAGAKTLVAEGAEVLAQDEASSVVWGMPGAIANAGLASAILPDTQIGEDIVRRVASASSR